MGANAQTSVPTFTAGEILTAANMNISARTGIPVFATSTTRDAAFGGTGEKTLAEGQFAYLEDSNTTQYYDGAAWQSVGTQSFKKISTTSFSNVASQAFDDVFTSTYKNYYVNVRVHGSATATLYWQFRYAGPTTQAAAYYGAFVGVDFAGTAANLLSNNANQISFASIGTSPSFCLASLFVYRGATGEVGEITGTTNSPVTAAGRAGGANNVTNVPYTGFILSASTGNITGTVQIYGIED